MSLHSARVALVHRWERIRGSLFFVPLAFAVAGVAVAEAALVVDRRVDDLPDRVTSTVDSARAVLGLVASATLTFVGIAFSVSLLLISAASSQFSPRVVHGLFRDPFNKRVMGIVVGTFVYCLVVIRAVRGPLEDTGDPVIPSLAVLFGGVLGVAAILSIVAFIDHAAYSMEVSTMLDRVTREGLRQRPGPQVEDLGADRGEPLPDGEGFVVDFADHGWVQTVDHDRLVRAVAPGSVVSVEVGAGRYAIPATPICRIWPQPEDADAVRRAVRNAVSIGPSRTLQQDATFGVRQLADVALKALSPGINDPTTAQDALFHMGAVVRELLDTDRGPRVHVAEDGTTLVLAEVATAAEIVDLAFDEVRLASSGQPTVLIYILEVLRLLRDSLDDDDHVDAIAALIRQASLVAEVGARSDLPPRDHDRIRASYDARFGSR